LFLFCKRFMPKLFF